MKLQVIEMGLVVLVHIITILFIKFIMIINDYNRLSSGPLKYQIKFILPCSF